MGSLSHLIEDLIRLEISPGASRPSAVSGPGLDLAFEGCPGGPAEGTAFRIPDDLRELPHHESDPAVAEADGLFGPFHELSEEEDQIEPDRGVVLVSEAPGYQTAVEALEECFLHLLRVLDSPRALHGPIQQRIDPDPGPQDRLSQALSGAGERRLDVRGQILFALRRTQEAVTALEDALDGMLENRHLQETLVELYTRMGLSDIASHYRSFLMPGGTR